MDTITERLEAIMEELGRLSDVIDELKEQQEEILEKLSNLSLPGGDYSIIDE